MDKIEFLNTVSYWCVLLFSFIVGISYFGAYVLNIDFYLDDRLNTIIGETVQEIGGIFSSNNTLGLVAYILLTFWLIYIETDPKKASLYTNIVTILFFAIVIHIGNRASMACAFFTLFLYFLVFKNRILWISIIASSIYLALFLFPDFVEQKLRLDQFSAEKKFGNRTELFDEGIQVMERMDFFGSGYANQRLSRKFYEVAVETDLNLNFHNTYLALITELGYIGFVLFFLFLFTPILYYLNLRDRNSKNVKINTFVGCILVGFLIFYLPFEDSINSPGSASFSFFWFLWFWYVISVSYKDQKDFKLKTTSI